MKRLISLAIISVSMCLLSVSCSSKNDFTVAFNGKGSFGYNKDKLTYCLLEKFSSLEELKSFCDEWNNDLFEEDSEIYNYDLPIKLRSYDEDFFKDYDLIAYVFFTGSGYNYKVKKIENQDNKTIVSIEKKAKKGLYNSVAFSYLILIEVNKADVSNSNVVEIKYI